MTDPIADMLTRVRNAVSARHNRVDVPVSRLKVEIARILLDEGYIQNYKIVAVDENTGKVVDDHAAGRQGLRPMLRIALKYGPRGENVISGIERISRPGRRVYFGRREVPPVLAGLGTSILTTSRGVMTGREAVKAGVGGEVLCNVW